MLVFLHLLVVHPSFSCGGELQILIHSASLRLSFSFFSSIVIAAAGIRNNTMHRSSSCECILSGVEAVLGQWRCLFLTSGAAPLALGQMVFVGLCLMESAA